MANSKDSFAGGCLEAACGGSCLTVMLALAWTIGGAAVVIQTDFDRHPTAISCGGTVNMGAGCVYDFNHMSAPSNNIYLWWGVYLGVTALIWGFLAYRAKTAQARMYRENLKNRTN